MRVREPKNSATTHTISMNPCFALQSYASVESTSTTGSWELRKEASPKRAPNIESGDKRHSSMSINTGSAESLVLTENISIHSHRRNVDSSDDSDQEVGLFNMCI